jgi:KDO2-lipid IV(A) lauroyltransferase
MTGEGSRNPARLEDDTTNSMLAILLRLLARLPLRWLHALGAIAGWLVDRASPRYARRITENLAASGVARDAAGLAGMRRRVVAELGKGAFELPALWCRPPDEVDPLMRAVRGWDIVDGARAAGRGVLLLTPHLGSFEIAALYAARRVPLTILYRPPKLAWLEPMLRAGRAGGLGQLAPTNLTGVRRLLKALRAGEAVGLLPDQVPGMGEGAWAPFFGRPAFTMTLVGRLQKATNCVLVLAFARRLPRGRGFEMDLEVLDADLSGPDGVARLNEAVESLVRRCPEQYLWSYNRYKAPRRAPPPPGDSP